MNNVYEYNPIHDFVSELSSKIYHQSNQLNIKYDNKKFISNIRNDIKLNAADYRNFKIDYSKNNMAVFFPTNEFFEANIKLCPLVKYKELNDYKLESILKRMYALIEFGYTDDETLIGLEIDICDNIFKSIYSKSKSIKEKNINKSLERLTNIQKEKYINIYVARGIIYSIYEYYSSTYNI